MSESLDFHFYTHPSAYNWILYFGYNGGKIQRTITLLISIKKEQNLCSNLSSECVISKTFRPNLEILYRSKVVVETVNEGHFSTHFLSDYGS